MSTSPSISIIIPTLNEAEGIRQLLNYLQQTLVGYEYELIIVDGGSTDATISYSTKLTDKVIRSKAGRAFQMNKGAAHASGQFLYFLHADTYPPKDLAEQIRQLQALGYESGCFQLAFSDPSWLLRQLSWFTRFNFTAFRFGDASLIVSKKAFEQLGGYDESFLLMEGNDIIRRLKKCSSFVVLPAKVTTSNRKYQRHGHWYLQFVYTTIYVLQRLGFSQKKLKQLLDLALKSSK